MMHGTRSGSIGLKKAPKKGVKQPKWLTSNQIRLSHWWKHVEYLSLARVLLSSVSSIFPASFIAFPMNHSRDNPRTWDALTIYLKHAFLWKRSIAISTADERPRLMNLPGCRPEYGLQPWLEAGESEGLFWKKIEAQKWLFREKSSFALSVLSQYFALEGSNSYSQ